MQLSPCESVDDLVPMLSDVEDNAETEDDSNDWVDPRDATEIQRELSAEPAVPVPVTFTQGLAEWVAFVSIFAA